MTEILRKTSWIVICVLLQVIFFDHFHVMGYGAPLIYILFLLDYRSNDNVISSMLWGTLLGLFVDMFHDSIGVNMMAMVFMVFIRGKIFDMFVRNRKLNDEYTLDFSSLGINIYTQILVIITFLYCVCLSWLEDITFKYFLQFLLKVVTGTFSTTALVLFYNFLRYYRRGR